MLKYKFVAYALVAYFAIKSYRFKKNIEGLSKDKNESNTWGYALKYSVLHPVDWKL